MREVADRAGVSVATVSNAINRPHVVSLKVRNRVSEAIRELGYVRNESARALRTGRSDEIGLVVPNATNLFWGPIVSAADLSASQFDVVVRIGNTFGDAERQARMFRRMINQRVHGLLVATIDREIGSLGAFAEAGIPVALLAQRSPAGEYCSVSTDDAAGGRLIGEHLVKLGHRNVAFIGDRSPERADAITGPIQSSGGALTRYSAPDSTLESGRRVAATIAALSEADRPTAIACSTDVRAIGVMLELLSRGIDVPGEISVTGYDDIEFAEAAIVPLTTVRQPSADIGSRAVKLLNEEILEGPDHRHSSIVFHPTFVERRSTAVAN